MNSKIKFNSLVICSTLNQMVNYIVIKEHDINIGNIYNIKLKNTNDKFDYGKWDKNLEDGFNNEIHLETIEYDEDEIENHKGIIDKLIEEFGGITSEEQVYSLKEEKILWNITGGQRHFIMAITEYVYKHRPEDVIVYFEGDKEKMYYYSKYEKVKEENILKKENYKMNIPIALRLMGFESSQSKKLKDMGSKYYNFLICDSEDNFLEIYKHKSIKKIDDIKIQDVYKQLDDEIKWYSKFYNIYSNSVTLRKLLVNSNRFPTDKITNKSKFCMIKEDIEEYKNEINNEINGKPKININDVFDKDGFEVFEKSIGNHKNGKVFGYILERMTICKILEVLKENAELLKNISDIDASVKIGDETENIKGLVDEFDILIVTKKGKVIMLECKSGGMTGDNAKSHNYSTYAVAGVYGAPILICPVLEEDNIEKIEEFDTNVSIQGKKICEINNDVYEHVRSARNAANKANLKICYVNDIENKIKELIKK